MDWFYLGFFWLVLFVGFLVIVLRLFGVYRVFGIGGLRVVVFFVFGVFSGLFRFVYRLNREGVGSIYL